MKQTNIQVGNKVTWNDDSTDQVFEVKAVYANGDVEIWEGDATELLRAWTLTNEKYLKIVSQ